MKKSANLVDKALEVARKERGVPKKPVKTKGKKTVPEALDWGPGIPLDKLAYLNDDEMALVQAKRMFKGKRKYKGIPAFPDPGDTAAGDRGQGTSSSGGLGNNTTGGGVGGSTEGSRQGGGGGSDSGAGGTSSSASGTGTTSSSDTTKTGSTSPASGSLSQPARTETSSYAGPSAVSAPTPPSGYQSYGGYDPTKTAPSKMASEATLNRIASGSSVIGNTTPQAYSAPKIQDRIAPVSYEQAPTTPVGPVDTTGANSPFADPEVQSYYADRPVVDQRQTVSLSNLADPNSQAAANYSFAQDNRLSGLSGYGTLNTPQETAMTQPTAATTPTASYNPEMSRIVAGDVPPRAMGTLPQGYAQTGRVLNTASLGYPTAPLSESMPPTQAAVGYTPTAPVAPSATTNVFYSSPAEQAADIRRAVALAQGPAPPPANVPTGVVPAGTATTPVGEYDYDPAQDPQNYMQPVYPGEEGGPYYMTDEQRAAYLDSVSGTRSSERPPSYYYEPEKEKPVEEEVVKKKKKPEPKPDEKYVRRNYMFENYGKGNAKTDADIAAFNRYNQENFNKGGRTNDSVQAALRIAKSKLL